MPSPLRRAVLELPRFNPSRFSNLLLWLDSSDSSTLFQDTGGTTPAVTNGSVIGLWKDKSGNGFNASQGTTANQPTLLINGTNNRNSLSFDGTDDFLDLSTQLGRPANWSIFAIAILNTATTRGDIIASCDSTSDGFSEWGSLDFNAGSTATFSYVFGDDTNFTQNYTNDNAIPISTPFLISCIHTDGLNSALSYLNGNVLTTPNTYGQTAYHSTGNVYPTTIGERPTSLSDTFHWNGSISEIIVYNRALTDPERLKIERYLGLKWGTNIS